MKTIQLDSNAGKRKVPATKEPEENNFHLRDISIWIDNYDDIFSDFDPRDFSERNISDDFLSEVKKVSRESDYRVNELKLLTPQDSRNIENENIIIKRLHAHFRKNQSYYFEELKSQNRKGILFTVIGFVLMMLASYISSLKSDSFLMHSLLVMIEPAGWFLVWAGLDQLIFYSREKKPELEFYNKFSKSKIVFVSI